MENTKIIIEVKGGLVQAVHGNSVDLEIDVLDYDTLEGGDKQEAEKVKRLEKQIKDEELEQIY